MQGVSDARERPGFFRQIMDSNVANIAKAYADAETLFTQLQVRCNVASRARNQPGCDLACSVKLLNIAVTHVFVRY